MRSNAAHKHFIYERCAKDPAAGRRRSWSLGWPLRRIAMIFAKARTLNSPVSFSRPGYQVSVYDEAVDPRNSWARTLATPTRTCQLLARYWFRAPRLRTERYPLVVDANGEAAGALILQADRTVDIQTLARSSCLIMSQGERRGGGSRPSATLRPRRMAALPLAEPKDPDHSRKPAGAVRPSGLAGGHHPGRRRRGGQRHLPHGQGLHRTT